MSDRLMANLLALAVESTGMPVVEIRSIIDAGLTQGLTLDHMLEVTQRLGFHQVRIEVSVNTMFGAMDLLDPNYGAHRDSLIRRLHRESPLTYEDADVLVNDGLTAGLTADDITTAFNRSGIAGVRAAVMAINWAAAAFPSSASET